MRIMGLDAGTTGCKAAVFNPEGKVLGFAFREYGVTADKDGNPEQDARQVWNLSMEAMREAIEKSQTKAVEAIGLSVQGDSVIATDADFNPVYPTLLGMDYRTQSILPLLEAKRPGRDYFYRTGMRPHPLNSFLKMIWLKKERPEAYARTKRFVTYADFLAGKLSGEAAIDLTMASRTMAFDLRRRAWDGELLGEFGIPEALLSRPVVSGTVVGVVRPEIARELGLEKAPKMVAGGHDQPVCSLGAGVTGSGHLVASTGTAEVLSRVLDEPILTDGMYDSYYPCYYSVLPGKMFTFSFNHYSGGLFRWYRDCWAGDERRKAAELGIDPYEAITGDMPAGPTKLLVSPHLNGSGTPECDFTAKCAFVGMTLGTTRAEVAKAILEALCFDLRINIERMRDLGMHAERITCVGGGAKSPVWLQLKADILNMPAVVLADKDAGCLGAGILAGTGSGVFASAAEGAKRCVRTEKTYTPNPGNAARYNERFALYCQLHQALKPINAKL